MSTVGKPARATSLSFTERSHWTEKGPPTWKSCMRNLGRYVGDSETLCVEVVFVKLDGQQWIWFLLAFIEGHKTLILQSVQLSPSSGIPLWRLSQVKDTQPHLVAIPLNLYTSKYIH